MPYLPVSYAGRGAFACTDPTLDTCPDVWAVRGGYNSYLPGLTHFTIGESRVLVAVPCPIRYKHDCMAFEKPSSLPAGLSREDRYILHNYYRLTSWAERWAHRLLLARERGDPLATPMQQRLVRQWRPADVPTLPELPTLTLGKLLTRAARRIRQENGGAIRWCHCPDCGALARTPRARLCPDCGHSWSGENSSPPPSTQATAQTARASAS